MGSGALIGILQRSNFLGPLFAPRHTVVYFGVPDHNNTFYPMFHGNIYLFGTWGLSLNMWMSNFEEGALWLLVWGCFSVTTELIVKKQY